jgi:hypothetical protein
MPPRTPIPVVKVDPSKPAWEQETPLHNRWHPEIPHVRARKGGGLEGGVWGRRAVAWLSVPMARGSGRRARAQQKGSPFPRTTRAH